MEIKRCYPVLVGASVAENQLVKNGNFESTDSVTALSGTLTVSNNIGTLTPNGDFSSTLHYGVRMGIVDGGLITGHKHLVRVSAKLSQTDKFRLRVGDVMVWSNTVPANTWTSIASVVDITTDNTLCTIYAYDDTLYTTNDSLSFRNCVITDLTAMFGSTIADYAYTLEKATAGSGIAWLRSYGFLKGYQAYNAGSIESVEVTEKKCVGFNQWDEEWEVGSYNFETGAKVSNTSRIRSTNKTPCIGGASYYFKAGANNAYGVMCYYDADENFISSYSYSGNATFTPPTNARYFAWTIVNYGTTYNNDICINLSSDRNGEYEPYKSITYSLGNDTLRGIFKLANGKIYADGDRKTADGIITRRYGTRAYQEGDESLSDAITDGTITVYKLLTPTTEQSTPFTSPQIVYPDGTEEFVTENGVPVGHETKYQL